jgi:hypothetical protein
LETAVPEAEGQSGIVAVEPVNMFIVHKPIVAQKESPVTTFEG